MRDERPCLFVISSLESRFHRDILHGVVKYIRQHTQWRLVCDQDVQAVERRKAGPAGVLIGSGDPQVVRVIREARLPFVVVGRITSERRASSVSVDEQALGTMAAQHLAGLGLRHFACVAHGEWPFVHDRLDAFARAAQPLAASPVRRLVGTFYDRRSRPRFEREVHALLRTLPRPAGILTVNDALGVELVAACQSIGLRVPDDIAILGVDNDEIPCEVSDVPLSSVAQPLVAIGYEGARLLHMQMTDPTTPPTRLLLPPLRVVARASSDLIALEDPDVVAALRLIDGHFAERINVDWVVRQLPVARRSLERKFKALVRRTILEQIHHVRLRKARELLAESDLGLEVVAQRSGFANARWLADTFRRELGVTPIRYRRQFRIEA